MMDLWEDQKLPRGYRWGAHWSRPDIGQSGYWIIRNRDEKGLQVGLVPDNQFELPVAQLRTKLEAAFADPEEIVED